MELLTVKEAAAQIHLCERSVHLLVKQGKLKAVHLGPAGRVLRFRLEALEDYVKSCEKYGPAGWEAQAPKRRR